MANIHGYFFIENLNLTTPQKATLVGELQGLGQNNSGDKPNEKNHWRVSVNNEALIFEGLFDEANLTVAAIKQRLANIFGVAVGTISHSSQQTIYGPITTFTHSSQPKLRMGAFGANGTVWGTWQQSNQAVRDYLVANAVAWGEA